jgi:SMC interacting uncharacterized protein involved in chromosome segregation
MILIQLSEKGDMIMTRRELEKKIDSLTRNLEMVKIEFENLEDEVEDDDLYDEISSVRESVEDTLNEVGKLQGSLENGEFSDSSI